MWNALWSSVQGTPIFVISLRHLTHDLQRCWGPLISYGFNENIRLLYLSFVPFSRSTRSWVCTLISQSKTADTSHHLKPDSKKKTLRHRTLGLSHALIKLQNTHWSQYSFSYWILDFDFVKTKEHPMAALQPYTNVYAFGSRETVLCNTEYYSAWLPQLTRMCSMGTL